MRRAGRGIFSFDRDDGEATRKAAEQQTLLNEYYSNLLDPEAALIALEEARETGELPDEDETEDPDSVTPEADEPFDDLGLN